MNSLRDSMKHYAIDWRTGEYVTLAEWRERQKRHKGRRNGKKKA